MSESHYRIRYRKGDLEVEVQGDKAWVEKKFKELTEGKLAPPEPPAPPTEIDLASISLVEFVKAKGNPSGHIDLTMIFAYWLHKKEKMTSYNRSNIANCYSEARIPKTTNIGAIMNANQSKGYLMPASEKKDRLKAWVITRTGEEYVEQMK